MEKYWLRIHGDVFIWNVENDYLIYNSSNGNKLKIKGSSALYTIYQELMIEDNLYCICIDEQQINNPEIKQFIELLKDNRMAELYPVKEGYLKPVSIPPIASIQRSKTAFIKDPETIKFENLVHYISDITLYLNGNITSENTFINQSIYFTKGNSQIDYLHITQLLDQLAFGKLQEIHLTGSNIFKYTHLYPLLDKLDQIHAIKKSMFLWINT